MKSLKGQTKLFSYLKYALIGATITYLQLHGTALLNRGIRHLFPNFYQHFFYSPYLYLKNPLVPMIASGIFSAFIKTGDWSQCKDIFFGKTFNGKYSSHLNPLHLLFFVLPFCGKIFSSYTHQQTGSLMRLLIPTLLTTAPIIKNISQGHWHWITLPIIPTLLMTCMAIIAGSFDGFNRVLSIY